MRRARDHSRLGRLSGALVPGELGRRRAAARRRRMRRSAIVLVALAACAGAAAVAIAGPGLDSGSARPAPARHTAVRHLPLATLHRDYPAPPHHLRRPPAHANSPMSGVDRLLAASGYLRAGGQAKREIALTFDDGPSPYTPLILKVLERTHTPATFFTVGRSLSAFGQFVAQEVRAGCVVGDHTETHAFLSLYGAAFQRAQIANEAAAVVRAGAPLPRLFRPPYGAFNHTTLSILRSLGMAMVLWSVDTEDYRRPGVARIVSAAISGARPGAVILMHDGGGDRSQTAAALPAIVAALRKRGYELVTVPQLLIDDPPPAHQPPPQPLSGLG
jgi:peptidoglycan/xylan/chitin deacetylase (PgdA/CDA1 family)